MKFLLLLPLLFLFAGCQATERDPNLVLPAFWQKVEDWRKAPSSGNASEVCSFLSKEALEDYPQENACEVALRSAFGVRSGSEVYRIETIREGRQVEGESRYLQTQPVALFIEDGKRSEVIQADSVAELLPEEDWAIRSLVGLSFAALLPQNKNTPSPLELVLLSS